MCKSDKILKFCTCTNTKVIHNQNSRRNKKQNITRTKEYFWFLSQFVNHFEPFMEGMLKMPNHQLNQELDNELVLENINEINNHCFDFEYQPVEGDSLYIEFGTDEDKGSSFDFFSFIYENNAWRVGMHDSFSTITKLLKKGKITIETKIN